VTPKIATGQVGNKGVASILKLRSDDIPWQH